MAINGRKSILVYAYWIAVRKRLPVCQSCSIGFCN